MVSKNSLSQIIPNSDFEAWTPSLIFTYDPDGWATDNVEAASARVVPDSMAYSNDLAMRVIGQPSALGIHGEASTIVPVFNQYSDYLTFYAKWQKTPSASVSVVVGFYTGISDLVYSVVWVPEVDTMDWSFVSIDLTTVLPEPPPINEIKITVSVDAGDFSPGEGWVAVDAMEFSSATDVDAISIGNVGFDVSPNPCRDFLHPSSDVDLWNSDYSIFDSQGRVVSVGKLDHVLDVSALSNGQYFIQIYQGESIVRQKFLVEK